jgi:predicted transcriptional regulator
MADEEISKTSFRLRKSLVKRVKQYALDNDTSVTNILEEALEDFLARKKGSKK